MRVANRPARSMEPVRHQRPARKLPVAVFKDPNRYGPTNPPRLPNEFMVPIAVAAAAWPRTAVGRVQSTGSHAWKENPIKQKKAIVNARRSPDKIAPARLHDVNRIGTAVC